MSHQRAISLPFTLVGDCQALPLLLALTTVISRLDAEALYFPRSFLQEFNFPFRPKFVTELLEKEEALYGPHKPVTAEPRPGRNDPCHCGTGKKYKKCCSQIEA